MSTEINPTAELIPLDSIDIVNPRDRNRKIFKEIVTNVAHVGLKKPITVARRQAPTGTRYDLVCGQGRLEAYRALGQTEIPAMVIDADSEDCLVMSLVENLARRQHRALDLLHDIRGLKSRGYSVPEIAAKTGLSTEYLHAVLKLLEKGEHRLLSAVESGQIPVSVAVQIADSDDEGVQRALQEAYESKLLRGARLLAARRLIEKRRRSGKAFKGSSHRRDHTPTSEALLRAYHDDANKKRHLVRKAEATRDRLIFVTEALRKLLGDDNFVTLLRAEMLDTMPKNLADRLQTVRT